MLADLFHKLRARAAVPETGPVGPVDTLLTATLLALIAFGVVMVYSASAVFAERQLHDAQHFLFRQAEYAVAGVILIVVAARIDYRHLRALTYPILAVTMGLMLYVAAGFGHAAGGAVVA